MKKYGETQSGPQYDIYSVGHPDHGWVQVVAVSSENAVLNACKEWDINWGLCACDCTPIKLAPAKKQRCRVCGTEIYTAGDGVCNRCKQDAAQVRQIIDQKRAQARREWA